MLLLFGKLYANTIHWQKNYVFVDQTVCFLMIFRFIHCIFIIIYYYYYCILIKFISPFTGVTEILSATHQRKCLAIQSSSFTMLHPFRVHTLNANPFEIVFYDTALQISSSCQHFAKQIPKILGIRKRVTFGYYS